MSFGFSITDFKEVIALSWRLYTSLKEAPQDLKDLAKDLATVYGVLNHVLDDIKCVTAHGEGRVKMLQTMIAGLKATLNEVQVLVDKFRPLAADQAKPEQLWLKIKWVVGHSKLKRIRQDISLHISSFTLLMTSMGNSSLQRIETGLAEMRLQAMEHDQESSERKREPAQPDPRQPPSTIATTVGPDLNQVLPNVPGSLNVSKAAVEESFPSWLTPRVDYPTIQFRKMALGLSPIDQCYLSEVIISNCQSACFNFYQRHALWRTTFRKDGMSKLFELPNGRFPQTGMDLTLSQWLAKLKHAETRLNEPDSVCYNHIYDFNGWRDTCGHFIMIPSISDPWGCIDTDMFEEGLLRAVQLCRHYGDWDAFGRLKALWREIHRWASTENPDEVLNYERSMP